LLAADKSASAASNWARAARRWSRTAARLHASEQKRARWRGMPARVTGIAALQRAQALGDDMV
jgi:hypothetical protein